ncbi:SabA family sialic acid-binding adhesin [Helicobacter pylori]|uniref:outer membrane protein n=1 Tax=Helicobacter pylori TaxID=210 RepID=UPI003B00BBF4
MNQAQAVANSLFNDSFNSKNPNAINWVINNLDGSANNLLDVKTNSPAYQAVLLAINAAVGFWNVVGYVTQCGGNAGGTKSTSSTTIFNNEPGYRSTSINCGINGFTPGIYSMMSIDNMKTINEAYQILQAALKKGLPALNQNNGTLNVSYSYTCSGEGNDNCFIKLADGKQLEQRGGSETTTQTIDGQKVSTTISSQVVDHNAQGNTLGYSYTEITNALNGVPDNAQALLAQASALIDTINTACPWVQKASSQFNGPQWPWSQGGVCNSFKDEISAIQGMIANAQDLVAQSKIIADTPLKEVTPNDFNPYSSTNTQLAQSMLANAKTQEEILSLANQVGQAINPSNLSANSNFQYFVTEYLATCNNPAISYGNPTTQGSPPGTVTNNTFASGCAYVAPTLNALKEYNSLYGNQISQAQIVANNLLKDIQDGMPGNAGNSGNSGNSGNGTTNKDHSASNTPNSSPQGPTNHPGNSPTNSGNSGNGTTNKHHSASNTPNSSPQGITHNHNNPNNPITNHIKSASNTPHSPFQELGHNPFRRIGIINSQSNNGAMNGVGVQVGYKQFFGKKRRWGLRYYGFFDYNHAFIKSSFFNSTSNVFTYGVGSDALFNFINDKATKNSKISFGLFGGIAIAGTSWLNSEYVNLKTVSNVYNAKINTTNFQFLFNAGLRMNLAKNKKKASDHVAQHGIELGVKIPTINTNYYSFMGAKLEYRRLYSVYLNYVFAY